MESLTPSAKGRWEARDLDSLHILDLEAATYERRPLPRKGALDGFDDHVSYHLLDEVIEWPRVGGRFLIRCTVRADPWRRHRVHQSATITQITRAPRAVDELAHTLPGSPMIRIPSGWCALVN